MHRQGEDTCRDPEHEWLFYSFVQGTVLATAGHDLTIHVLDARNPDGSTSMKVKSDIECLGWNPHLPFQLYCSTEDGGLTCYDVRSVAAPVASIKAHSKALSAFSFSPGAPGLLATCSADKTVKLWDTRVSCLREDSSVFSGRVADAFCTLCLQEGAPVQLGEKSMAVGKLFTIAFYPSSPFLLAAGGDKGSLALWNLNEVDAVVRRFGAPQTAEQEAAAEVVTTSLSDMQLDAEKAGGAEPSQGGAGKGKKAGKKGKKGREK
jgi:periodic tryptophan protein 1